MNKAGMGHQEGCSVPAFCVILNRENDGVKYRVKKETYEKM